MEALRPARENILVRHATAIAIGTVTLLMALAGFIFWEQGRKGDEAREWVLHTYEVRGHIRLLSGLFKDAEAAHSSYLATGDSDYLEPYREALRDSKTVTTGEVKADTHRSIAQEVAILKALTKDNPTQQGNIDELEAYVGRVLEHMSATIRIRQAEGTVASPDFRRGKVLMDRIRNTLRLMEVEESHLLALRVESDDLHSKQDRVLTLSVIAIFYVILVVAIWIYQRSRAKAAAQMLLYTQELERSEEELKMQQEELKASNEEIEASNEELEEKSRALEEQNTQIQQQSEELEESKGLIEEKARELERASKYKSEFLANMSHELRTPLNSLLILAKMLAANEDGNLTEAQVEEAHVIHNGGLELLGLINDILDLSKVEAGKLRVVSEDVVLDSITEHMRQQFAPVIRDKDVSFPIIVADGLPPVLRTDSQRVEQILKNLLSNAFKFTEKRIGDA